MFSIEVTASEKDQLEEEDVVDRLRKVCVSSSTVRQLSFLLIVHVTRPVVPHTTEFRIM